MATPETLTAARSSHRHDRFRKSRATVLVLGSGRTAQTMVRRATAAGFSVNSVVDDPVRAVQHCQQQGETLVLALTEPSLLSRETLHCFDLQGTRVIGVVSHQRQRTWAQLLPLLETVWLFAPAAQYKSALSRYHRAGTQAVYD